MPKTLHYCINAKGTVLTSYIYYSENLVARYVNNEKYLLQRNRTTLVSIEEETRRVDKKSYLYILFSWMTLKTLLYMLFVDGLN